MYSKYSLFYKSHKNLGYYAYVQTVSTRPLFRGEWPGDEARCGVTIKPGSKTTAEAVTQSY